MIDPEDLYTPEQQKGLGIFRKLVEFAEAEGGEEEEGTYIAERIRYPDETDEPDD